LSQYPKILEGFIAHCKQNPDAVALKEGERTLSYEGLYKRAVDLSHYLSKIPCDSASPYIGVYARDNFNMVVGILSSSLIGAAFVPLNPEMSAEGLQAIIDDLKLQTVIAEKDSPDFTNCRKLDFDAIESNDDLVPVMQQELAYVLYTSGSTGKAKGVPIKQEGLLDLISYFQETHSISSQDRFLQCAEWTFDLSIWTLFLSLNSGATCVCLAKTGIVHLEVLRALSTEKITCVNIVPSIVQFASAYFNEIDLPHLRLCVFAGEALPTSLAKEWQKVAPNCSIENHYGLTESTVHASRYVWKGSEEEGKKPFVSIGMFYPHLEWAIRDSDNNIGTELRLGELLLSGSQIIDHYINHQFPERFVESELASNGRYFCTGDLVEFDEQNNLHFLGRSDRQFQLNGYRIEPSEIEQAILQGLGRKAVVMRKLNNRDMFYLLAVIEGEPLDKQDCTKVLKTYLTDYKIPYQFIFVSKFSLNLNGKIDRKRIVREFSKL